MAENDRWHNSYSPGFQRVTIPVGKSGQWSVEHNVLTGRDVGLENLRLQMHGQHRRVLPPGTYTRLLHGGATVMSDTPGESHEHCRLLNAARGRVLLNGLGLGFALAAILRKPGVDAVTVIEKSTDVLALVRPHIVDDRLTIINADALEWRPTKGVRFDVVWHDIWTDICDDNRAEMTKLRRAYGPRTDWQSCWSEEYMGRS